MKLKTEVKEKLIIVGLIILSILLLIAIGKYDKETYNKCMSEHNDKNFCYKLIEG